MPLTKLNWCGFVFFNLIIKTKWKTCHFERGRYDTGSVILVAEVPDVNNTIS